MMRIGILGGAYDPIHNGHLALAEAAVRKLRLDHLYFVPSFASPIATHEKCTVPGDLRLEMVKAAIGGLPHLKVSKMELERKGISYTVDTVREFRKQFPLPDELFFIAGADWASSLSQWKEMDVIFSLCRFVVATRPGHQDLALPKSVQSLRFKAFDISSTQIRQKIREGKSVDAWVPKPALMIIQKHGLYQKS